MLLVAWQRRRDGLAVVAACRHGIALDFHPIPGLDHDELMAQGTPTMLDWARDRFAGKPATNNCPAVLKEATPGKAKAP